MACDIGFINLIIYISWEMLLYYKITIKFKIYCDGIWIFDMVKNNLIEI